MKICSKIAYMHIVIPLIIICAVLSGGTNLSDSVFTFNFVTMYSVYSVEYAFWYQKRALPVLPLKREDIYGYKLVLQLIIFLIYGCVCTLTTLVVGDVVTATSQLLYMSMQVMILTGIELLLQSINSVNNLNGEDDWIMKGILLLVIGVFAFGILKAMLMDKFLDYKGNIIMAFLSLMISTIILAVSFIVMKKLIQLHKKVDMKEENT